jgi:hypothetical protein
MEFRDRFDGRDLDRSVWFPYYLPHWSSRAETAANYELVDDGLRLYIPPDLPLWCADRHPTPLRVSAIASGSYSGPVGSTDGPQAIEPGLTVTEEQPRLDGWLPTGGRVEIRCRMTVSPRSMGAMWLAGFEERAGEAGEICVVEVFGKDADIDSAEVGVGHKQLFDPDLRHDFEAPRLRIDVGGFHTYAVDWDSRRSIFTVDGVEVKRCSEPPTYPMQVMIGVFDFPEWSSGDDDDLVPELVVAHVAGSGVGATRDS